MKLRKGTRHLPHLLLFRISWLLLCAMFLVHIHPQLIIIQGVYGDNGSLLYHHGYGYAPYGAYSPALSQQYQYPTPYYQSPTLPPSGPYSSNQTSAAPTDVPTSVAASVEAVNGNANDVSKASAGGNNNNGATPVKSANSNSTLNSNGSYGRVFCLEAFLVTQDLVMMG